jgi:hypothetical protein
MARQFRLSICLLSVLLTAASTAVADSIVDQVPQDALGFGVVRNLSQADARIAKAMSALRAPLPAPLAMIKTMTGVSAGLDPGRDLLVVMLPPENESRAFHLAVWLPVKDYDALVRSLDGDPQRKIAAATIAGEDVLIAHIGESAVVMDPDSRDRLSRLTESATPATHNAVDLARFIDQDSDVSVVVTAAGLQTAGAWAAATDDATRPQGDAAAGGQTQPGQIVQLRPVPPNDNSWRAVWQSTQSMLADAQELKRMAMEAKGVGCSLRLDDAGNAVVKVRAALTRDTEPGAVNGKVGKRENAAAPRIYDGGAFVLTGSGEVSKQWIMPLVGPYVRQTASDLATQFGAKVDDAGLAKFRTTVEQAVAQARAVTVLTRPGADQDGVYSGSFLAVQVASADEFVKQLKAAFDQWNAMLDKTEGASALVFDQAPIAVEGREGAEYSIDMAKASGAGSFPEARQSMERLFGQGGRFRLQYVKVDESTVLLSMASQDQLSAPIRVLQGKAATQAVDEKLQAATQLLKGNSDWQLSVSLDGYNQWLKRQLEAIVGPVIGGPIVRPFPESPPVAAAGGTDKDVIWSEVAVPADTLRGIGQFMHP